MVPIVYNEMKKRLDFYISKEMFVEKYVVIFGSNEPAECMMEYLLENGIKTDCLVDNNIKKEGTVLNGVVVALPEKALLPKKENAVILIASKYYPEMLVQLNGLGYEENIHVLKIVEYSSHSTVLVDEAEFERRLDWIKRGQQIYENLMNGYKGNEMIFVCPLIVLGDAYVAMSLLHQYTNEKNITNYVVVVVNKVCEKVSHLFGFEHVLMLSEEDTGALNQYALFTHMADGHVKIVHHRYPYTVRIGEMGNYKRVNFMDHFKYSIFNLSESSKPEAPSAIRDGKESIEYVKALLKKEELKKGKTVILFPYAKTAAKVPVSFWESLVKSLNKNGFDVCTNSGSMEEPAIKGTKAIFFDIRYALETVEAAGYVIALRSGLCDVISTAKAKKIILYPDRFYGSDSFLNFFSLINMELCQDAIEVVYNKEEDEMVANIMEYVI